MIDVLVPVLGRPVHAMLRSLEYATTVPFDVFFLCSPGDDEQIELCKGTGYTTWVVDWPPGRGDWAKKLNWGYRKTSDEWIFQGADDIRFSPGWDTEALRVASFHNVGIVGTQDLHNPSVLAKQHATHILIRRSYIEEQGGTFDGTGEIFCERYDHQYPDNELIALAKLRKQWAFSDKSIVEHLHPVWNLAEWDPTYEKAFRESDADRRLFASRLRIMRSGSRQWRRRIQST